MKVVDPKTYEALRNEQIRLVSKKHVEGLSRREHERLERVSREVSESRTEESVVEFDYYY